MSFVFTTRALRIAGACVDQLNIARQIWGDEAFVADEDGWVAGIQAHVAYAPSGRANLDWLTRKWLHPDRKAEYEAAIAAPRATFDAVATQARNTQLALREPAHAAFVSAGRTAKAQAAFEAAVLPAHAAMKETVAQARGAYNAKCAAIFARLYWRQIHGIE